MKMFSCLVLCLVAVLPTAFSDVNNNQNYEPILNAPYRRSGEDFDTLLGHSFGTSKRQFAKKNFDEIDAAGFNDFSKRSGSIDAAPFKVFSKKNFDEIDNAGFKDYLRKRNFDEIDAAGFNDFSKRTGSTDSAKDKVVKNDGYVKDKKNFDEIDAAGFNDFSKRKHDGHDLCEHKPGSDDEKTDKYNRIKAFLYALKHKMHDDLAPYYEEYKNGKFDERDGEFYDFLSTFDLGLNTPYYSAQDYNKYDYYDAVSKRSNDADYSAHSLGYNFANYDMPPYYSPYYKGKFDSFLPFYPSYYSGKNLDFPPFYPLYYNEKNGDYVPYFGGKQGDCSSFQPSYFPVIPDKNYIPPSYSGFLPHIIRYYKQKYGRNMGGLDGALGHDGPSKYNAAGKPYYQGPDSDLSYYKYRNLHFNNDPKNHP